MILKEAFAKYLANEQKEWKLEAQIEKKQKQLERLRNKNPHWITAILHPLAKALCEKLDGVKWEVMGPFGLGSETSIYVYMNETDKTFDDRQEYYGLHFRPDLPHNPKWDTRHETRQINPFGVRVIGKEETDEYPENSIGAVNGFNRRSMDIPEDADLDWFVAQMYHFVPKVETSEEQE